MSWNSILVTGGVGFLGQYLIAELTSQYPAASITVLDEKHNPHPVVDLGRFPTVTVLSRDICKPGAIDDDFRGVDLVIHLAGIVSFSLRDRALLYRVNVGGTRNVLKAAMKHQVSLFVHVSSVAALGFSDDESFPVNEEFEFDWNVARMRRKHYMFSKHLADKEVRKAMERGLPSTILYPGLMYGPGDVRNTGFLLNTVATRGVPFHVPGGTNVVDVRDVARGIALVLKNGTAGTDFCLSGFNLSLERIMDVIARYVGVDSPTVKLSPILNSPLFYVALVYEYLLGRRALLMADTVDSMFRIRYFDNGRAKRELGWEPEIPFEKSIDDAVRWMRQHGLFER